MEDIQLKGHYWNKADKSYKYKIECNKDRLKVSKVQETLRNTIFKDMRYYNWKIISDVGGRTEEQQLKESRDTKQSHGHIVSYNPFNILQLDIFVFKNYESSNYGYILCIIDIFSRKVWCIL